MLLAVILLLLLLGNWFLSAVLVFLPFNLTNYLISIGWLGIGLIGLAFLAWCLGDE